MNTNEKLSAELSETYGATGVPNYVSGWRKDVVLNYVSGWRKDVVLNYVSGWRKDVVPNYVSGWRKDVVNQWSEFGAWAIDRSSLDSCSVSVSKVNATVWNDV